MKVVFSGANGYIGYKLVSYHLQHGDDVLAISCNTCDKLNDIKSKYPNSLELCDIIDDTLPIQIFAFHADVIFSTTCCYETDVRFIDKMIDANYGFPARLLKIAHNYASMNKLSRVPRFISISTCLPPTLNLYSLTKNQFDEIGEYFASLNKINFVNVQLENFYGYDEPHDRFIPSCIRKLREGKDLDVTVGTQCRDFIYVEDVIKVLYFLAHIKSVKENPCTVQLGSGTAPQIKEILLWLKKITLSSSKINFGIVPSRKDEPSTCANLNTLRDLGYTDPFLYWQDGMKLMVDNIK